MGYETTLYVGECWDNINTTPERNYHVPTRDDGEYQLDTINIGGTETHYISRYFSMIAMFELCKCGDSNIGRLEGTKGHAEPEYINGYPAIYGIYQHLDHNKNQHLGEDVEIDTKVNVDCYGNIMTPVPIQDVIDALQRDVDEAGGYWRFNFALDGLKSIRSHNSRNDNIFVLFFGH